MWMNKKTLFSVFCVVLVPAHVEYLGVLVYQRKVETKALIIRILDAACHVRNCRQELGNATSAVHARARQCLEAESSTFENVRQHRLRRQEH